MNTTLEDKNKATVLEAFETLFNRRDYPAAEKFWSPNYLQHSAHIPPGRDGLFNLVNEIRTRVGRSEQRLRDAPRPILGAWPGHAKLGHCGHRPR